VIRWSLVALLIAAGSQAQEIGKEIPPPAGNGSGQSYDNPYGSPTQGNGAPPGNPPPAPPAVSATNASAGSLTLGIRSSFSFPSQSAPTADFGIVFFLGDHFRLTLDGGLSMDFNDSSLIAFKAALGGELVLRSTQASARPFILAQVGVGKSYPIKTCTGAFCRTSDNFSVLASVGVGGEYFFTPGFSLNVHALVSLPVVFADSSTSLGLILFTPGVGATVYF
jgi:hypothetical protein